MQVPGSLFEVFTRQVGSRVVGIGPHRRERLIQFMVDTRRHLAERRQLGCLDQFVAGVLVFFDLLAQQPVGLGQILGAAADALLEFVQGLLHRGAAFGLTLTSPSVACGVQPRAGYQQQQGTHRKQAGLYHLR